MYHHVLDKYFKHILPLCALQIKKKKKVILISVLLLLVISTLGFEDKKIIVCAYTLFTFSHTLWYYLAIF